MAKVGWHHSNYPYILTTSQIPFSQIFTLSDNSDFTLLAYRDWARRLLLFLWYRAAVLLSI